MAVELGIIEGYYGKPWSWHEREDTMRFLARHGYSFYMYAPKDDVYLRRLWREPHPDDVAQSLAQLAGTCRHTGVRFGVGISPTKVHIEFDNAAKEALQRKLQFLDDLHIDDLAILFDDMRGDFTDLADRQAEVIDWAADRTNAKRIIVCPSYYTDDPVLDRVFGTRPDGYVERIGEVIDPSIEIFWTGEEVVSRQFSRGHLERVANQLRRKPFIWDNYPVNDGERMSQFLHVRGVSGRPASMAGLVAAHGINPCLQPVLARIPALTLEQSYIKGDDYEYLVEFRRAAHTVLGPELGESLYYDLLLLQDVGLDKLGDKAALLRQHFGDSQHPGAREIMAWLDGEYRITDAIVTAQSGED